MSMFCIPINIRGAVTGVVQMVNKIGGDGVFTKEDEVTMEQFVAYIGSALHHAKLYDKIRKSEQRIKVTQEVLSYHNQAKPEEVDILMAEGVPTVEKHEDISTQIFLYYATGLGDMDKIRKSLFMFVDLFGLERYNFERLVNF